jgi:Thermolysin metallopeptidase, alpha-helical domain/Thermolysin metallopeptidase, catalytic domain/TIR domain
MRAPSKTGPATVFYSYSHRDERLRDVLATHLSLLRREGVISEWHDRRITPGDTWQQSIDENIDRADIILLLVSADFIASDYCWGNEVVQAIGRHASGAAQVIPIIIRPVDWGGAVFGKLQALPENGKPITLWSNRDLAWVNVAKGIRTAVEALRKPSEKSEAAPAPSADVAAPRRPRATRSSKGLKRLIYTAENGLNLPGKLVREEGSAPLGDPAVDEVYDALGVTYEFFRTQFRRDSIDDKGIPLKASVHYGVGYNNAFWNGRQMIFGDGDGKKFNRFTGLDVLAKEFSKGVLQYSAELSYYGQAGALTESISTVFATLVKQYALHQTVSQADWLVGEGLLGPGVKGKALLSLAFPGTAYNDRALDGKDRQPADMRHYVKTQSDNGGVHLNQGIPNRAFYLAATTIGGFAWEKAGRIWYEAVRDEPLRAEKTEFVDFARITHTVAGRLYGEGGDEAAAVRTAWETVGVWLSSSSRGRKAPTKSPRPRTRAQADTPV